MRYIILFALLLSTIQVSAQSTWYIAPGYLQSYTHNYIVKADNYYLSNNEYTPLNFNINSLDGMGYAYSEDNSTLVHNITMTEIKRTSQFIPTGSLPIVLPLNYNGISQWPSRFGDDFGDIVANNSNIVPDNTTVSVVQQTTILTLSFELKLVNFSYAERGTYWVYEILTPVIDVLNYKVAEFYNTNMTISMEYILRSGILSVFDVEFVAQSYRIDNRVGLRPINVAYSSIFAISLPPVNESNVGMHVLDVFTAVIIAARLPQFRRVYLRDQSDHQSMR